MDHVRQCLRYYIEECIKYFGEDFLCYNVHSLIHLPDDYVRFGYLERVSAFKFENFNSRNTKDVAKAGQHKRPELAIASHNEICAQKSKLEFF